MTTLEFIELLLCSGVMLHRTSCHYSLTFFHTVCTCSWYGAKGCVEESDHDCHGSRCQKSAQDEACLEFPRQVGSV